MLSRRPPPGAGEAAPRRRWHGLLPAAIVAGFVLVFLLLFGDRLWPAAKVSVIPVLAVEQAGGESSVAVPPAAGDPAKLPMLFQASGWIEPDPLPTKATVLIETILAAFEMDEILFALKDHIVGLNCGRWDYIFRYIGCSMWPVGEFWAMHPGSTRFMSAR